jgi:hypothetical protein
VGWRRLGRDGIGLGWGGLVGSRRIRGFYYFSGLGLCPWLVGEWRCRATALSFGCARSVARLVQPTDEKQTETYPKNRSHNNSSSKTGAGTEREQPRMETDAGHTGLPKQTNTTKNLYLSLLLYMLLV